MIGNIQVKKCLLTSFALLSANLSATKITFVSHDGKKSPLLNDKDTQI